MAYRYTPAFVAYCKGAPAEEIAAAFKIPLKSLKAKMREEGWRGLAEKLMEQIPVPSRRDEQALAKCEANRVKNLQMADALREDLIRTLNHLRDGTLRIGKQWHNRGAVVEYAAEPTIADRVALANYATMIANLTYRALGDVSPSDPAAPAGAPPPPPPITVILPALVAQPREKRLGECSELNSPGEGNLLTDGS
jgi:hypothetical protein